MSVTDPRQYHWYQTCVQCTGVSGAEPEGVGEGVELCAGLAVSGRVAKNWCARP